MTFVETREHRPEMERAIKVTRDSPKAILIGSVGLHTLLRGEGINGLDIEPTKDVDVVLSQADAELFSKLHGGKLTREPLVDMRRRKYGVPMGDNYTGEILLLSTDPFGFLRVVHEDMRGEDILRKVDIFTEMTGVGPIPVTEHVLNAGFVEVQLEELKVRVAKPFFLFATHANPFARTAIRMKRLGYLIPEAYVALGEDAYEKEVKMALRYISYGKANVLDLEPKYSRFRKEEKVRNYDGRVVMVGDYVGTELRKKIEHVGRKMGIGSVEIGRAVGIFADLFSSYRSLEKRTELAELAI
jgi:hypothetical protein